jgi:hypothetical protein
MEEGCAWWITNDGTGKCAICQIGVRRYYGNSTDTKPTTGIMQGTEYYEFDTGMVYIYDGISTWWPV